MALFHTEIIAVIPLSCVGNQKIFPGWNVRLSSNCQVIAVGHASHRQLPEPWADGDALRRQSERAAQTLSAGDEELYRQYEE